MVLEVNIQDPSQVPIKQWNGNFLLPVSHLILFSLMVKLICWQYFSIYSPDNSTPDRWFYWKINKLATNPHRFVSGQLCWHGSCRRLNPSREVGHLPTDLGIPQRLAQGMASTLSIFLLIKIKINGHANWLKVSGVFSSNIPNSKNITYTHIYSIITISQCTSPCLVTNNFLWWGLFFFWYH